MYVYIYIYIYICIHIDIYIQTRIYTRGAALVHGVQADESLQLQLGRHRGPPGAS